MAGRSIISDLAALSAAPSVSTTSRLRTACNSANVLMPRRCGATVLGIVRTSCRLRCGWSVGSDSIHRRCASRSMSISDRICRRSGVLCEPGRGALEVLLARAAANARFSAPRGAVGHGCPDRRPGAACGRGRRRYGEEAQIATPRSARLTAHTSGRHGLRFNRTPFLVCRRSTIPIGRLSCGRG
jgi:hypothetical protein